MAEEEKKYDAITLDTNVFVSKDKNINLGSGLIGSMGQFSMDSDSHVKFILSEIVHEEILNHIKNKIKKAKENITRSIESLKINRLLNDKQINEIKALFNSFPIEEEAKNIIERFEFWSGCVIIKYSDVALKDVFKKYFQQQPPFEEQKKKHEFPDAVALMSLERWAEKNKMHVLAVSEDTDWANYAEKSNWIDVEKELGKALEKFQEQKIKIREYIESLLLEIYNASETKLLDQMSEKIKEAICNSDIEIEGRSRNGYDVEGTLTDIEYLGFSYSPDVNFSLVNTQKNLITFMMSINTEANIHCNFGLYVISSEANVLMEIIEFTQEYPFSVNFLITITGTSSLNKNNFDGVDISNVEVIDIDIIDFGIID